MTIKHTKYFDYYESETEPPLEGPKIWFRPSDAAHFGRDENLGWVRYDPINVVAKLKVGESIEAKVSS